MLRKIIFNNLLIAAVLVMMLMLVFAGVALFKRNAPTPQSPQLDTSFSLTDENGRPTTQEDYSGRYKLVFFGFTHCPDICPLHLQTIGETLDLLGDKAEQVAPLFITLDPARDTLEVLRTYTDYFHPALIGLRGTESQTTAITKGFRLYASKVPTEDGYTLDHSALTYLLSPEGDYIKVFTTQDKAETIAQYLTSLLP